MLHFTSSATRGLCYQQTTTTAHEINTETSTSSRFPADWKPEACLLFILVPLASDANLSETHQQLPGVTHIQQVDIFKDFKVF